MEKSKLMILGLTVSLVLASCEVLEEASKTVSQNLPSAATSNKPQLTNQEVISGLKEALSVGIKNSVNVTSVTDGFLKNTAIRLPFPPDALKVRQKALVLSVLLLMRLEEMEVEWQCSLKIHQ